MYSRAYKLGIVPSRHASSGLLFSNRFTVLYEPKLVYDTGGSVAPKKEEESLVCRSGYG